MCSQFLLIHSSSTSTLKAVFTYHYVSLLYMSKLRNYCKIFCLLITLQKYTLFTLKTLLHHHHLEPQDIQPTYCTFISIIVKLQYSEDNHLFVHVREAIKKNRNQTQRRIALFVPEFRICSYYYTVDARKNK